MLLGDRPVGSGGGVIILDGLLISLVQARLKLLTGGARLARLGLARHVDRVRQVRETRPGRGQMTSGDSVAAPFT